MAIFNPMNQKIVVLTGAGVSAESGINTFRDANGLWEGHDVIQNWCLISIIKDEDSSLK